MTAVVCSDKSMSKSLMLNILYVLGGSVFLALMSQCAVPLPFTIVPLTLQTLGVLLLGGLLGSKRGTLAVLAYIAEGAMGLPVFAAGGAGLGVLMGPKGGYYLGFICAAFLVGYILERIQGKRRSLFFLTFFLSELVILTLGTLWLSLFIGSQQAVIMGFLPFIFCGMTKAICAASITKVSTKIFKRSTL